jgi:hypothetical protein
LELLMLTSQRLLVRLAARALVVLSTMLLAIVAMVLGWIITAHASGGPHDARSHDIHLACERGGAPDCPALITKPATLANSAKPGLPAGGKRKQR